MPRTVEKTVFKFGELSDAAKERARDWWRSCENQDFDTEFVFDDAVECGKILGIEISTHPVKLMGGGTRYDPTIYYSGFSSQGDGACFEGTYSYAKGSTKAIRKQAPLTAELHRIADELLSLQRVCGYRLNAYMKHRGHYYHSGCMDVDVEFSDDRYGDEPIAADAVRQCMRDFADWIYKQLNDEYDYHMSDEQVDENIECNDYEFDECGKIYG